MQLRMREEVKIKPMRPADVSENAPQLIRLVRFPFVLAPVRPMRRSGFERPDRDPLPQPGREMGQFGRGLGQALGPEFRRGYTLESPTARPRPELRPHPFARARLASEGDGS
jgi:hypothetical protein